MSRLDPLDERMALPSEIIFGKCLGIGRCERERRTCYSSGPVGGVATSVNRPHPILIAGCRSEAGIVKRGGGRRRIKIRNIADGVGSLELVALRSAV
jgi:hypothetical protein